MRNEQPARVQRSVGRPRSPEPSLPVSTRLPQAAHDKLMLLANRSGQSVSEVLRSIVVIQLK